jgi:ribosomal protein S18 acetylase RimI-like enzyme
VHQTQPRCVTANRRIVMVVGTGISIRRVNPDEKESVQRLVQVIADETFAYLFASAQVPIGVSDWLPGWVAISGDEIVGVTMTRDEWVTDLWVRRDHRRTGVGRRLLAHAEVEIQSRGYRSIRLRVVKSNTRAVEFYRSHGWKVHRTFPHEKFGHAMFEMMKPSGLSPQCHATQCFDRNP